MKKFESDVEEGRDEGIKEAENVEIEHEEDTQSSDKKIESDANNFKEMPRRSKRNTEIKSYTEYF